MVFAKNDPYFRGLSCTIGLVRSSLAKNDLHCTFLTWRGGESWLRITFVVRVLTMRSVQYGGGSTP